MSPEEIGRAYLATAGFRWQVGMVSEQRGLVVEVVGGEALMWLDLLGGGLIDDGGLDERPTPDTTHEQTLDIIGGTVLRAAWPGHSVQVERFPDGTARVLVYKAEPPDAMGRPRHASTCVFRIAHEPVAIALLRALEAAPL